METAFCLSTKQFPPPPAYLVQYYLRVDPSHKVLVLSYESTYSNEKPKDRPFREEGEIAELMVKSVFVLYGTAKCKVLS